MQGLRKWEVLGALVLGGSVGTGCSEWVVINSVPQGATCYIDGRLRGATPVRTVVESTAVGPNPSIRLEKDGYEDLTGILKKKAQPGKIAADLLLGSLAPLAMVNNAALVSADYCFELKPEEKAARGGPVPKKRQIAANPRPEIVSRLAAGVVNRDAPGLSPTVLEGRSFRAPRRQPPARSRTGQVCSAGPRMGVVHVGGDAAKYLKAAYDAEPVLSAWGWQWEYQYETSPGGPTGLVEFVPLILGAEQGLSLLTANLLFGMRTATEREFAVGPNVSAGGVGLTLAIGKTFKAHGMNFPVNLALVSGRDGVRTSLTFGWNMRQ